MSCYHRDFVSDLVWFGILWFFGNMLVRLFKSLRVRQGTPEDLVVARFDIWDGATSEPQLVAEEPGVRVLLHRRRGTVMRRSAAAWHLEIRTFVPLVETVTIVPRVIRNKPQYIPDVAPWLTGDKAFDDAAYVRGDVRGLLTLCAPRVRPELMRWIQTGGAVAEGALWLSSSTVPYYGISPEYEDFLAGAIHTARNLSDAVERDFRATLIETAQTDSSDTMRGAALVQLRAMLAGDPVVQQVFADALKSESVWLVEATLPYVGAHAVEELDALVASGDRPEALRLAAFDRLLAVAPNDARTSRRIAEMVLDPQVVCSATALRAAVRLGLPDARTWVLEAAAAHSDPLRAAAFSLLPDVWEPEDEAFLLQRMPSEPESVTDAAVNTLARCGTPSAIPSLFHLSEAEAYSEQVRAGAVAAIHSIRERHGSAGAGTFALVEAPAGDAGAISIAHDEVERPDVVTARR